MASPAFTMVCPSDMPSANADGLQDSLLEFHAKHFLGSAPPNKPAEEFYEEEGDDDGLGYYDDGVKRTLTDEQIAIFRHSEIHDLIQRCVRAKLEREEAEAEAAAEKEDAEISNGTVTAAVSAAGDVGANSGYNATVLKTAKELLEPPTSKSQKRKRKRPAKAEAGNNDRRNPEDFKDEPKGKTYRRICRDMDTIMDESITLDY
jgi:hypothetical protein